MKNLCFREECSSKSGKNDGSCASGFGVCCTCKFFLVLSNLSDVGRGGQKWNDSNAFKTFV